MRRQYKLASFFVDWLIHRVVYAVFEHSAVSTIEAIYHTACIAQKSILAASSNTNTDSNTNTIANTNTKNNNNNNNNCSNGNSNSNSNSNSNYNILLLLFELQRRRMLEERKSGRKDTLPRAMNVAGYGIGDWNEVLGRFDMKISS